MLKMRYVEGATFPDLTDFVQAYPKAAKLALKVAFQFFCKENAEALKEMTQDDKWDEYIGWQRDEPYDSIEKIGWAVVKQKHIKAAIVDVNLEDRNTGPNEYEWVLRIYQIIPQEKQDLVEMLELMEVELPEVVADHLLPD